MPHTSTEIATGRQLGARVKPTGFVLPPTARRGLWRLFCAVASLGTLLMIWHFSVGTLFNSVLGASYFSTSVSA
jgi:hypothetical protein